MRKIIVFVLLPFALSAQKNYPQLLDQYMTAQNQVKGFTGAVLVMQKNKIVLRKGYGLAR